MFLISFHNADIAGKHGGDGEEKEDAVGNDGMGYDPEFQRQGQHGAGPDGGHIVLQDPLDIPDEEGDGKGAADDGRKPGGQVRESEKGVGKGKEPVYHDRFVIPEGTVNLGRYPVAGRGHFLGG